MRTDLFDYSLPPELIAQRPLASRDAARVLVLHDPVEHRSIRDLPKLIPAGALLVLNDTRVFCARLLGTRAPGGGAAELLLLRRSGPPGPRETWRALARPKRRLRPEMQLDFGEIRGTVLGPSDAGELVVELEAEPSVEAALERVGHVPLPPYVRRDDEPADRERYQTVYASHTGSVAAPTAGLHLTRELLRRIEQRGVTIAHLTLHVGPGTFRPVSADDLDDHDMHSEQLFIGPDLVAAVRAARFRGAPVVAVGTTVVRALESAADPQRRGHVLPLQGETRLLIQPGHDFRVVDALLTNFHMPKSTLLALVAAFAGIDRVRAAYAAAIGERYRFLSYGDAMWIPERGA